MNTQQKLIGATYIAKHLNLKYERGQTDCLTVFLGYHDALWGTNKLAEIKGKYSDRKSAIQFYRNMKLSWRQWLFINGYKKSEEKFTEGDIAVLDNGLYPTVYIYHNGAFWTMSEDRNFIGVDANVLSQHENVTVWRHK